MFALDCKELDYKGFTAQRDHRHPGQVPENSIALGRSKPPQTSPTSPKKCFRCGRAFGAYRVAPTIRSPAKWRCAHCSTLIYNIPPKINILRTPFGDVRR